MAKNVKLPNGDTALVIASIDENGVLVLTNTGAPAVYTIQTDSTYTQEGASKISPITLSGVSQSTSSIPEQMVIVHNGSNAIIYIEPGAGAVAVTGQSQPLASGQQTLIRKAANSEIAVIGAGTGDVYFSPQVSVYA